MIKAIIFDWDGVIVDSMPWIYKAMQEVLFSYGINKSTEEVSNDFFQPRDDYYNSYGVDIIDKEELERRHRASIKKHKMVDPLFPEVKDVLLFLKKNNYILGICSSTDNAEILRQLKSFGLEDIFEENLIFGGEIIEKEEKLEKFLKVLNVSPSELVYVGDLASDITAAQKVKVKSAGIERREEARRKLTLLKPDYLFSFLNDLVAILEDLI